MNDNYKSILRSSVSLVDLKRLAKNHGLSGSGSRSEILDRLKDKKIENTFMYDDDLELETVIALRQKAKNSGIKVSAKDKKYDLLEKIRQQIQQKISPKKVSFSGSDSDTTVRLSSSRSSSSRSSYNKLSISDLKDFAKNRGISGSGSRSEIIKRLKDRNVNMNIMYDDELEIDTIPQLKQLANTKGIKLLSKDKKADILEKIRSRLTPKIKKRVSIDKNKRILPKSILKTSPIKVKKNQKAPRSSPLRTTDENNLLPLLTVIALRTLAKEKGIKIPSSYVKKVDLIKLITDNKPKVIAKNTEEVIVNIVEDIRASDLRKSEDDEKTQPIEDDEKTQPLSQGDIQTVDVVVDTIFQYETKGLKETKTVFDKEYRKNFESNCDNHIKNIMRLIKFQ